MLTKKINTREVFRTPVFKGTKTGTEISNVDEPEPKKSQTFQAPTSSIAFGVGGPRRGRRGVFGRTGDENDYSMRKRTRRLYSIGGGRETVSYFYRKPESRARNGDSGFRQNGTGEIGTATETTADTIFPSAVPTENTCLWPASKTRTFPVGYGETRKRRIL